MKIEIWSDIMCPFCYMGKKQLERALDMVPYKDEVNIIWRSFELNPDINYTPNYSVTEYLASQKNLTIEQVNQMQAKIVAQGAELGIDFQFDKAPVCNSRNAHKLIHAAQKQDKGNEIKEALFHAYFTLGQNVQDTNTLLEISQKVGLDLTEWNNNPFESNSLEEEVNQDIYDAHQVGARGVPFFVFNEAYSLSGAHGADTLYKILETVKIKFKHESF